MSLKDELIAARAKTYNSRKWSDIEQDLHVLRQHYGDTDRKWKVVRSDFHGGGVISHHRTATAALLRARSERMSDCICGCADVVPAEPIKCE